MRIGLKAGEKGADVERLHRALTLAGLHITPGEIKRREFGASTLDAIHSLQSQRGLPVRDEIDDLTYAALLEIERPVAITVSEDAPPAKPTVQNEHHGSVRGKFVDEDGAAIIGTRVVLFAKNIRSETQLGETTTDTQGQYSIAYDRPAALNLTVRAYDASGKVIAKSATVFAAAAQTKIDFTTAASGVVTTPSTLTTIRKTIEPQLQGTPLSGLKENEDAHELQFLASASGIAFNEIGTLFIAQVLGARNKINEATFFGIFDQGIPSSLNAALARLPASGIDDAFIAQVLSGVLTHSRTLLEQALAGALKANVLPASYAAMRESELTLLDSVRMQSMGNNPFATGKTALNDLLTAGGVADAAKTAFAREYARNNGHLEATRQVLRANNNLQAADLDTLDLTLTAGELLAGNVPLVKDTLSRLPQKTLTGVQNLALLDENDWTAKITEVDPQAASIPAVLPDDTPQQKIFLFAKGLSARFSAKYPTTAFAGRLSKDQASSFAKTKDELVGFLTANPTFAFKSTNIDHFIATNKISISADALADAKTAQRLSRIAGDYASVEALRKAGHHSAQSVYFKGRQPFVAEMTTPLGSALAAQTVYARAQMTYATALVAFGQYNLAINGTRVAALASAAPDPALLTGLPDLQALFGSLDYFECGDCQSVLSPAAYLVDLLQFLNQIAATATGLPVGVTPPANAKQALLVRRPDIQYVALSCNNTNITLPYIDLVNEILEAAIAPPATPVTLIDTVGSSAERRALPQQTLQPAYALTATAVFPLTLPFDLGFARTTAYIGALGTTRAAILTLFAGSQPAPATAAAIAGASFGINPEMQAVIDGTDTHQEWDRWGLTQGQTTVLDPKTRQTLNLSPPSWITALSNVPVLLNRAGLTIQQLYQLLEVQWVTQSGVTLRPGTLLVSGFVQLLPDIDLMVFTGLTGDVLDRANRFLRLWTASGLQMWELDWAIEGSGGTVSDTFLSFLANAVATAAQLKLPFQEVLGFWLPLETRDVTSHLGDEDTVVPSTYSEVFRNPAVLSSWSGVFVPVSPLTIAAASNTSPIAITTSLRHGYQTGMQVSITGALGNTAANGTFTITVTSPVAFSLNGTTGNGVWTKGGVATGVLSGNAIVPASSAPPTHEQSAISAALGLSAGDISAILGASATLSVAALGELLNYQRLASSLSLDIADLNEWIQLTGGKPFGGAPADTLEFLRRLAVLQETGLAVQDLDYLLRDQSATESSLAFTTAQSTAVLQTIRDALARFPGATSTPPAAIDPVSVQTIFVTALAAATGTTANVVTPVLLKTAVLPLTSNVVAMLVAQTQGVDPTQFSGLVSAFTSVAKAAALFSALKPSETEFVFVVQNAATFNWLDPSTLPLAPVSSSPYGLFEALLRALRLNKRQSARTPKLFDILGQWLPPNTPPADLPSAITGPSGLALGLNANANDVLAIATELGAKAPSLAAATQTGSLADMAMLSSIASALDVAERYSIAGATLVQLAAIPATSDTASAAASAVQAQYSQSAWFGAIQQVEDALRQSRRDALVAYILGQGPAAPATPTVPVPPLFTTDDIYDYYLIDPEMSPCAQTTRLLQASLAIQQFVQQCFLNLISSNVTVDMTSATASSLWSEWSWRQQYRLWQANREVFLYPENYVLPETRTDASSFFTDLENDLRQANVDGDAAETAIENYLRSLVNVSRLQVAAHYNETKADGTFVLHVFAHTNGTPPQWYYRTRTGSAIATGSWSAWEALNLDIASPQIIPVVWDQRLHLIWPIFQQIAGQPQQTDIVVPTASGGAASMPQSFWAIQFAMSELSAGQWQAKRTINEKMYVSSSQVPQLWFNFQASEQSSSLQLQGWVGGIQPFVQATLPMPESPLSVVELESILPESAFIDTVQEPSYLLIATITQGNETTPPLSAPTGYSFSGQDLVYGTDNFFGVPAQGPLNVLCRTASPEPPVSITLLGATITNPRIVVPQQEPVFNSDDPFFFADSSRTYLAERLSWGYDGVAFSAAYVFKTCYHPYARTFLRVLETGGIPQLMSRNLQLNVQALSGRPVFDFNSYYGPNAQYVPLPYPGTAGGPDTGEAALDFAPGSSGAYSLYNWELFYHAPMFIASLLMQNQQYQDAMTWLEYIFNPTDMSGGPSPQRFWQLAPFNAMQSADWLNQQIQTLLDTLAAGNVQGGIPPTTTAAIQNWIANPFDPHAVASLRISAYAVATVMKFLDNLIAWGDWYYNQFTAEMVSQAEQLYILADMILGPQPQALRLPGANQSGAVTATYASLQNLDLFSNTLVNIENVFVAPEPPQAIVNGTATTPSLPLLSGTPSALLFCIPPNSQLLAYWDTVSQRLYNIRHCLNLQGVAQPLPLYAPPINPLLLAEAQAAGGTFPNVTQAAPIYRFAIYLQKAIELTNDVRAYGALILSALEKQDGETLSVLRANQELDIQNRMLALKELQVTEAQDQITALKNQKAVVQVRYKFYSTISFMNGCEISALALQAEALIANALAVILDATSGAAHLVPTATVGVSGFGGTPAVTVSFGGENVASAASSFATLFRGVGGLLSEGAGIAATVGGYQRRQDDWTMQANLANAELTQMDSQIAAATDRQKIADTEWEIQNAQISNAQIVSNFLTNKYTNAQLYNWMVSQLTTVYTQAYQLAFSLALQAQNAYQYELGSQDTFIQFGYWDSQHKGLTAGESLVFDLRRMEAQYLAGNSRELELTKHISLALTSPLQLVMLRETGQCQIALDEVLFERDYPGQYFRRLRSVALTIPCVTGPYTGVNATLSLTNAIVRVQAPGSGYQPQGAAAAPNDPTVVSSPMAATRTSTIATSGGQNDAGLFDVNLRDERWLPFEGQGVISTWNLVLDPRDNNFDFSTITDVVLHIRYTARGGGNQTAANNVRAALKPTTPRSIFVSVRNTFGGAYYTFFNPGAAATGQTLTLPLTNVIFPFSNLGSGGVTILGVNFYFVLSVPAAGNTIAATFSFTGETPASLSLAPANMQTTAGNAIAALAASATPSPPVPTPQSVLVTVPAASVPAALATTVNGQTLLDPTKIEDILITVDYSID
jgi:hypothetical protein